MAQGQRPGDKRSQSKSQSKSRERKGECFLCCKPSPSKCPGCSVHYCSPDHLLAHRQHGYCFPYRVKWKAGKGRSLVATRDIAPLELIMFDAAIVTGPQASSSPCPPVCPECCSSMQSSTTCGMCGMPVCSESCQVGASHYLECQVFRTLTPRLSGTDFKEGGNYIYQSIAPLRLLMKRNTNPKWFRRTQFLMDHRELREVDPGYCQQQARVCHFLLKTCRLNFTEDDVQWAIGLLKTNTIMFGETGARALFPMFSLMNHSCSSNAKHTLYTQKKRIAVQAQCAIKEGEEITINYVPFIQGTVLRRRKLQKHWFFLCECPRCTSPTELGSNLSTLRCPKCDDGFLTQSHPKDSKSAWTCQVHTYSIPSERVIEMCEELKRDMFLMGNGGTTVSEMETFLSSSLLPYLHPHHTLCMLTKRNIVSLYSQESLKSLTREDFIRIKELCEESLEVLGKVDAGFPLWRAETLKDLSTARMNLARTDFEAGLISRPDFLAQVKQSMKLVEEASNCKSCIKVERTLEDGETLKEEFATS